MMDELRQAIDLLQRARRMAEAEEWWLVNGMLKGAQEILTCVEQEVKPLVETLDSGEED